MKAWVLEEIGSIQYKEIRMPQLQKDEVLVRVKACGICGSDIQRIYENGAHRMPLVLGHEFAGEIVDVGNPHNAGFIGKRVGVFPLIPCKLCNSCSRGKYEMCSNYGYLGSRSNGAFAEYVAVPRWNVIELAEEVSFEEGAMLEPLAVAAHSIRRLAVAKEESVVVYGMGTIGQLISKLLLQKGMSNIYVVGNKDIQKTAALNMGIIEEHYCDYRKEDVQHFIHSHTRERGASAVFECVGKNETVNQSIQMASSEGKVCLIGNPYTDMRFEQMTYWKILRKQLTIVGSWNSSFCGTTNNSTEKMSEEIMDDWQFVLQLLKNKELSILDLITHKMPLNELNQGFKLMKDKDEEYTKIMALNK